MYLLYLDESGSLTDPKLNFYVLAGVAIFERQTHWVEGELNSIAERFDKNNPTDIELHGSPMWTGKNSWRKIDLEDRKNAIESALQVIAIKKNNLRLFASVISRNSKSSRTCEEVAFEQISSRFDQFLRRKHLNNETQRGLIIFDKSSTEQKIQTLARDFKFEGNSWGKNRNYAEVPVFLDSKASRLIQLADLVAYAIFRKYQYNEDFLYKVIEKQFDTDAGKVHGLYVD